jgi:hypothetical protein
MPNAPSLSTALSYLRAVVLGRLRVYLGQVEAFEVEGVAFLEDGSPFARFCEQHKPTFEEYITLLLALVPHVQPQFLSNIMAEALPNGGDLPEFGGVRGTHHRGILPTGETAQFVLAGADLSKRLQVQQLLSPDHWLAQQHILTLEPVREGEPAMSGRLVLDIEIVELLTVGKVSLPRFSTDFPAERISTQLNWSDLVLHPNTQSHIEDLKDWMRWDSTLRQDYTLQKHLKKGYRVLFYGPPGTGKTLTASLLGKLANKEVFRVDLSQTVSKYIGETEKNLSKLFNKAENKDWILFFDEADALFGKRTDIRDAHDKYANQEVAYLLQRIESYNGLVILASNQRTNIDEAFTRRFQSIIHFPFPRPEERIQLWQKAMPATVPLAANVSWPQIAAQFDLTGANIINIVQYCLISFLVENKKTLDYQQIERGIIRELVKEGKLT